MTRWTFLYPKSKDLPMRYMMNDIEEFVIREDDKGDRYIKSKRNMQERPVSKDYGPAWGVSDGFGVYNYLAPITKERYESFGVTWTWASTGEIISL